MPAPSSRVISSPAREVSCPATTPPPAGDMCQCGAQPGPGAGLGCWCWWRVKVVRCFPVKNAARLEAAAPVHHVAPHTAAAGPHLCWLLSTQNMVINTLTHNNATWTHTDTGHSPWQLLFKQFSSSQINVSQNMFARSCSQLGTFYTFYPSLYRDPTLASLGLGSGYWVAAEARWRCCKSSWISPFTLQQDLLRWTGDQGGTLVTTLKIRLLWPFCFMEQILFILFIFFIPQYWTLLLLNFLLSLHGSTALNEDRKISVLFFKTSVSN